MRCILAVVLCITSFSAYAQSIIFGDKASIYLVRHGEKESGDDPLLTAEGNKRAGDLARTLKDKKITRVYVTEFKRTQNTADSVRLQLGVDTVHYMGDTTGNDLAEKILAHNDLNSVILIVGHSNTVPKLIQKLGLPDYPRDYIPANEFDNLFLLTFKKGKATLTKEKYGALSAASATMH